MKRNLVIIIFECSLGGNLLLEQDYLIKPVPFTSVKVEDDFWASLIERNHPVTIPLALDQCNSTGRVDNFIFAVKIKKGEFCTEVSFDDKEIYKIIEGKSYTLQKFPDQVLESCVNTLIYYISKAQEPNGGCRAPTTWKVLYQTDNGVWKEVSAKSEYGVVKDQFNTVDFEEFMTGSLKLEVQWSKEFSRDILESIVE